MGSSDKVYSEAENEINTRGAVRSTIGCRSSHLPNSIFSEVGWDLGKGVDSDIAAQVHPDLGQSCPK